MKKNLKDIALHEKDTGSSEMQIGYLTEKIENISKHINKRHEQNRAHHKNL